jgi:hypothetical protein
MVEGFPHGAAQQDIAHQAIRAVGKTFAYIKDEASGAVGGKVGAIARRPEYGLEVYQRLPTSVTAAVTEILASLPLGIKAIGDKAIAERTKRSSFVVVTTQYPIVGVFVRLVATQVNNAASVQVMIDDGQDQVGAEGGIAGHGVHV